MADLEALAGIVDEAARTATPVTQLGEGAEFSVAEAYEIQRLSVARRLARGEARAGIKMGFTSRAKMAQMGLSDLIWGRLTDAMRIEEGGRADPARFIHPRCEPEVAFLIGAPLAGRLSPAEAMAHVEAVAPALEVIDSRYENFKFTLPDVIADNASSSGFVVGPWTAPDADVGNLGMVLEVDGRPVQAGSSAAILGHPARALAAAARVAAEVGEPIEAGWIVMAGGATAAVSLAPGTHVRVAVERLGYAGFRLEA